MTRATRQPLKRLIEEGALSEVSAKSRRAWNKRIAADNAAKEKAKRDAEIADTAKSIATGATPAPPSTPYNTQSQEQEALETIATDTTETATAATKTATDATETKKTDKSSETEPDQPVVLDPTVSYRASQIRKSLADRNKQSAGDLGAGRTPAKKYAARRKEEIKAHPFPKMNRKQGNTFRAWVIANHPSSAKGMDLSASGSSRNPYIQRAWKRHGAAYTKAGETEKADAAFAAGEAKEKKAARLDKAIKHQEYTGATKEQADELWANVQKNKAAPDAEVKEGLIMKEELMNILKEELISEIGRARTMDTPLSVRGARFRSEKEKEAEKDFFGDPLESTREHDVGPTGTQSLSAVDIEPVELFNSAEEEELLQLSFRSDKKTNIIYRALFVEKDPVALAIYNRFKKEGKNIFGNEKEFFKEYAEGPEATAKAKELFQQAIDTRDSRPEGAIDDAGTLRGMGGPKGRSADPRVQAAVRDAWEQLRAEEAAPAKRKSAPTVWLDRSKLKEAILEELKEAMGQSTPADVRAGEWSNMVDTEQQRVAAMNKASTTPARVEDGSNAALAATKLNQQVGQASDILNQPGTGAGTSVWGSSGYGAEETVGDPGAGAGRREDKDDAVSRKIRYLKKNEGMPHAQAVAVALSMKERGELEENQVLSKNDILSIIKEEIIADLRRSLDEQSVQTVRHKSGNKPKETLIGADVDPITGGDAITKALASTAPAAQSELPGLGAIQGAALAGEEQRANIPPGTEVPTFTDFAPQVDAPPAEQQAGPGLRYTSERPSIADEKAAEAVRQVQADVDWEEGAQKRSDDYLRRVRKDQIRNRIEMEARMDEESMLADLATELDMSPDETQQLWSGSGAPLAVAAAGGQPPRTPMGPEDKKAVQRLYQAMRSGGDPDPADVKAYKELMQKYNPTRWQRLTKIPRAIGSKIPFIPLSIRTATGIPHSVTRSRPMGPGTSRFGTFMGRHLPGVTRAGLGQASRGALGLPGYVGNYAGRAGQPFAQHLVYGAPENWKYAKPGTPEAEAQERYFATNPDAGFAASLFGRGGTRHKDLSRKNVGWEPGDDPLMQPRNPRHNLGGGQVMALNPDEPGTQISDIDHVPSKRLPIPIVGSDQSGVGVGDIDYSLFGRLFGGEKMVSGATPYSKEKAAALQKSGREEGEAAAEAEAKRVDRVADIAEEEGLSTEEAERVVAALEADEAGEGFEYKAEAALEDVTEFIYETWEGDPDTPTKEKLKAVPSEQLESYMLTPAFGNLSGSEQGRTIRGLFDAEWLSREEEEAKKDLQESLTRDRWALLAGVRK